MTHLSSEDKAQLRQLLVSWKSIPRSCQLLPSLVIRKTHRATWAPLIQKAVCNWRHIHHLGWPQTKEFYEALLFLSSNTAARIFVNWISQKWLQTTFETTLHLNHDNGIKKRVGIHQFQILFNTIIIFVHTVHVWFIWLPFSLLRSGNALTPMSKYHAN